ncbi:hypothetical protein EV360DRAFT_13425, partial [Lentinula raphanica]
LQSHIPPIKITQSNGLSNLLSWFGTGQGNITASFLSYISGRSGNSTFWAENIQEVISNFLGAQLHNEKKVASYPGIQFDYRQERLPENIPGTLRLSNCKIYGSASNLLKLLPTPKKGDPAASTIISHSMLYYHLEEKFQPYWTAEVQTKWEAFLGELYNQNPMTHNSSRPSWLAGIEFLDKLHIPGFQKSLTAMQLANTLALSHVLEHPTLSEMAYWIWNHQDLGAFLGLQKVGFMMPTQKAVLVALTSFSRHIWNMNTTQLQIIGCTNGSVIDSEHFLCKIARWSSKI